MGWFTAGFIVVALWVIVELLEGWRRARAREADAWDVVEAFVRDLEATERAAAAAARFAKFNADIAARHLAAVEAGRLDTRKTAARLLKRAVAAEVEREEYRQLLDLSDAERREAAAKWDGWRAEFDAVQVKNARRAAVGDKLAELLRTEGYAVERQPAGPS